MSDNNIYAGFWKRFVAIIIDSIILIVFVNILKACLEPMIMKNLIEHANNTATLPLTGIILYAIAVFIIPVLYFALWESSSKQATWGKQVMRIKVVDSQGKQLSVYRSFARTIGKILSGLPFYMGFVMSGISQQKQALHDKMANTYVVDKDYTPGTPLPLLQKHLGCIISLCITGGLFIILFLMIILSGKVHFSGSTGNPDKDFQIALNRLYHTHIAAQGNYVRQTRQGVRVSVGGTSKYAIFKIGRYIFTRNDKKVRMMVEGHPEVAFGIDTNEKLCCEPHQPNACEFYQNSRDLNICPTN